VPVDFEVVNVNSALEMEDDINNAITAIRRNGIALKGKLNSFFFFFFFFQCHNWSGIFENLVRPAFIIDHDTDI